MIIWGIAYYDYDEELYEELQAKAEASNLPVKFVTCYSVSAYQPEAAVLGIVLSGESCLFNPVRVGWECPVPTYIQAQTLQAFLDEHGIKSVIGPRAYVFENTDD